MTYDDEQERICEEIAYLSALVENIKNKIDIRLGKHTYIDMYVENRKIIIVVEEKYFSQVENMIRNYHVGGLGYEVTYGFCSFLRFEQIIDLVQFCIVS